MADTPEEITLQPEPEPERLEYHSSMSEAELHAWAEQTLNDMREANGAIEEAEKKLALAERDRDAEKARADRADRLLETVNREHEASAKLFADKASALGPRIDELQAKVAELTDELDKTKRAAAAEVGVAQEALKLSQRAERASRAAAAKADADAAAAVKLATDRAERAEKANRALVEANTRRVQREAQRAADEASKRAAAAEPVKLPIPGPGVGGETP